MKHGMSPEWLALLLMVDLKVRHRSASRHAASQTVEAPHIHRAVGKPAGWSLQLRDIIQGKAGFRRQEIFSYRAMPNDNVSLESSVAIGEDVVSRDLDGEAVILNLESGVYFGLDKVGTRIWSLLQEDRSLRRAFEVVQQEYDVAPEKLEGDLLRLVEELRAKGLLRVSSSQEGQPTRA